MLRSALVGVLLALGVLGGVLLRSTRAVPHHPIPADHVHYECALAPARHPGALAGSRDLGGPLG